MQSAKSTTTIQIRGDKRLIAQGGYAYDQSLLNALVFFFFSFQSALPLLPPTLLFWFLTTPRQTLKVYGQGIRQCIGHKQDIDMKKHDYKSYVVVMHYGIDSRKDKKGEPIINPFL